MAQRPSKRHKKAKLPKACKTELRNYRQQNIHPIMKAAHEKFTAGLSTEDLTFLNEKRVEAKALHQEKRAAHKKARTARKNGATRDEIKDQMHATREVLKTKKKALMETMRPFLERNKELIKANMEPLKEQHKKWREDKKAIIDKYLTEEQRQKMKAHKTDCKENCKKHPKKGEAHEKRHKIRAVEKFIFWDGEMKMPPNDEGQEVIEKSTNLESLNAPTTTMSNYPNPAFTQTTIIINSSEAQKNVLLLITDTQGKQVLKRQINKLDAGENQLDINLKRFTSGQYFYTLHIGENIITKTLLVK